VTKKVRNSLPRLSSSALTPFTGYATASVEGRIAVEYVDPAPEIQDKKYAFKCHRQTIDDVDHVWAVNALAFHPL
jgi:cell cycle arrest protein BUB3